MLTPAKLLGIFLLLTLAVTNALSSDLENLVRRSDSLYYAGSYDSVITCSWRILAEYPEEIKNADSLKFRLLANIGTAYRLKRQYDRAETILSENLSFSREKFGEFSYQVGLLYGMLSNVYTENGYTGTAIAYSNLARNIFDKAFGPDNKYSMQSLHNTALMEMTVGKLDHAEAKFKKVLDICNRDLGEDSPLTVKCLRNLGVLYSKKVMYARAEEYYEKALEIKIKKYGTDSPEAAILSLDFADLYINMARDHEAESLLIKSINIFQSGPDDLQLYLAKANIFLANLYTRQNRYPQALPLLEQALKIREEQLGSDHPETAQTLELLGNLYAVQGLFETAEPIIEKTVSLQVKRYGMSHIYTAYAYRRLCDFYMLKGDLSKAEQAIDSSMAGIALLFDKDDYLMISCLESRRDLYWRQGKIEPTLADARKAMELRSETFFNNAITMAEADAYNYAPYIRNALSKFLTVFFENPALQQNLLNDAIKLILFNKGLITDGIIERRLAVLMSEDPAAQSLFDSLKTLRFEQSRLFFSTPDSNSEKTVQRNLLIETAMDNVEKTLIKDYANINQWQKFRKIDKEKLIALLPEDAVYIDYFKFDHYRRTDLKAEPHYLAIILSPRREPLLADLGRAEIIDALAEKYRLHMLQMSEGGGIITAGDRQKYQEIASSLYALLWQPVADRIPPDCSRLLIVPDDALNRISFAGLPDSANIYLVEKYMVHYLSSGRDLLRIGETFKSGRGVFALGDPDYNSSRGECTPLSQENGNLYDDPAKENSATRANRGGLKNLRLNRLPGTSREINLVAEIWRKSSPGSVDIYTGDRASEACFKSHVTGKRIVHLATHGYFLDNPGTAYRSPGDNGMKKPSVGENPLLLSGLFFAGANIKTAAAGADEFDDGILTANEVVALNLEGVELVVLSACESGLGELQAGEGVFGLRRAFQMAGARTVISTLWPISDKSGLDVFTHLYESFNSPPAESVREGQLAKIRQLRTSGQSDHPYSWDGYVIFGDWRKQ